MKNKNILTFLRNVGLFCVVFVTCIVNAQTPSEIIPVWDGVAPGSEDWTQKESLVEIIGDPSNPSSSDTVIWNVTHPTITVYKPALGRGPAGKSVGFSHFDRNSLIILNI